MRRTGLGVVALVSASALPAAAQELPALVVTRGAGAVDCPDAHALARAVERLNGRPSLDPTLSTAAATWLHVEVTHDASGFVARIHAGGRRSGDRMLADVGPGCDNLGDALALTLAILTDNDAGRVSIEPRTPARPDWSTPRARPRDGPTIDLELHGGGVVGVLYRPGAELSGGLVLSSGDAQVAAMAFYVPPQSIDRGPGSVDVALLGGAARACWVPIGRAGSLRAGGCGLLMGGALRGSGHGYDVDRTAARPWFAGAGGAIAEGPLSGAVGWSLLVVVVAPFSRETFSVQGLGSAYAPSAVGVLASAGVTVEL